PGAADRDTADPGAADCDTEADTSSADTSSADRDTTNCVYLGSSHLLINVGGISNPDNPGGRSGLDTAVSVELLVKI
ncbi:MAG: hypothetical protein WCS37_20345, partial [Chloroflexota bacterium]